MTGKQWENFRESDPKEYILKKNKQFLKWYSQKQKEGYKTRLSLDELQKLIDYTVFFFEFKYHDRLLENTEFDLGYDFHKSIEIARRMDCNELKYRLPKYYEYLLNPTYKTQAVISKKDYYLNDIWDIKDIYVRFDEEGNLDNFTLEMLKETKFLTDTTNIKTIHDLSSRLRRIDYIDSHNLDDIIYNYNTTIELRNIIFNLIPLALVYSGGPIYGLARAKAFIRMFNKEYNINIDTTKIDEIVKKDYSKSVSKKNEAEMPKRKIKERIKLPKKN